MLHTKIDQLTLAICSGLVSFFWLLLGIVRIVRFHFDSPIEGFICCRRLLDRAVIGWLCFGPGELVSACPETSIEGSDKQKHDPRTQC